MTVKLLYLGLALAALDIGAIAICQDAGPKVAGSRAQAPERSAVRVDGRQALRAYKPGLPIAPKRIAARFLQARSGKRAVLRSLRQRLADKLELSLEQRREIAAINERYRARYREFRSSRADKRALLREHRQALLDVLTPEQRQRLKELAQRALHAAKALRSKKSPPTAPSRPKGVGEQPAF